MINSLMLIGRMTKDVETKEKDGKEYAEIVIAVNRSFKNADGIYETDFIPVILWNGIANNVKKYCRKGDLMGIKGRIETREDKIVVIAEKVSFLSSNKEILKENGVENVRNKEEL